MLIGLPSKDKDPLFIWSVHTVNQGLLKNLKIALPVPLRVNRNCKIRVINNARSFSFLFLFFHLCNLQYCLSSFCNTAPEIFMRFSLFQSK